MIQQPPKTGLSKKAFKIVLRLLALLTDKSNRTSRAALCCFSPLSSPTPDPFSALLYISLHLGGWPGYNLWLWLCQPMQVLAEDWKAWGGWSQSIYFPPRLSPLPLGLVSLTVAAVLFHAYSSCQVLVTLFPPLAPSGLRVSTAFHCC